ncbi:FecCD family ABC transporter permease [Gallibacter intestinalis]|uniref:Probable heme-iron transport system permease protein IsdF n=1 Tax=Gallibacter intestinalis TaxID=2779356 RepID=A0ABR9QWH7_9FIRM|nr:iron ABC transporter permease [Gallibacter intestinalis]MBE5035220.1 iron ABC transporter permease [Gallibacter intestinalis]
MERRKKKAIGAFAVTGLLLIATILFSINTGSLSISGANIDIIMDLRIPRILISIVGGAGIAVSGVLLQAVMKNPLADPGILGISAGSSLSAILITGLVPSMYFLTPIFSFIGGVVACFLVYTLSWKDGLSAFRIILVGITINTVFVALIDCAESLMGGNNALASFTESRLSMKGWDDFYMLLTYSVVFVVLGVLLASRCDLLALEDRTVGSLGINVTALRIKVSAVAVFLAAICTSVLGTVSFLGLLAPYIGRMLVGSGHKTLIPYSMIAGALLMLLADTTGRTIAAPNEISAAVIMAVIGGPCFIVLLRRASGSYGR